MGEGIELSEHPYGVCSTASSTVAKTVTVDFSGTLTLFTGLTVRVKFSNPNTAASPTLNVNSTGAVSVMSYGTTAAGPGAWAAGEIVTFIYDGTNWVMVKCSDAQSIITVTFTNVTSTPQTKSNSAITADHVVLDAQFSNPAAMASNNWTAVTSAGSVTINGSISGLSTDIYLILGKATLNIT
jgi:hypothetical protein